MPNNKVKSRFLLIFKMFITLLTIYNTGNGIVDFVEDVFYAQPNDAQDLRTKMNPLERLIKISLT